MSPLETVKDFNAEARSYGEKQHLPKAHELVSATLPTIGFFFPRGQVHHSLTVLLFSASPRLRVEMLTCQTSYYKSSLAKIHFHYHSCVRRREAAAGYLADSPGLVGCRFLGIRRDRRGG
jgi:hypothetical protein